MEPDSYAELLGSIYDAALDPAAWGGFAASLGRFVDASSCTLQLRDADFRVVGPLVTTSTVEAATVQAYVSHYGRLDPWATGWLRQNKPDIYCGDSLTDQSGLAVTCVPKVLVWNMFYFSGLHDACGECPDSWGIRTKRYERLSQCWVGERGWDGCCGWSRRAQTGRVGALMSWSSARTVIFRLPEHRQLAEGDGGWQQRDYLDRGRWQRCRHRCRQLNNVSALTYLNLQAHIGITV